MKLPRKLKERFEAVDAILSNSALIAKLRKSLEGLPDLGRGQSICSRADKIILSHLSKACLGYSIKGSLYWLHDVGGLLIIFTV